MELEHPKFTITHNSGNGWISEQAWLAQVTSGWGHYTQYGRTPQGALQHLLDAMIEGIGSTQQEEAPVPLEENPWKSEMLKRHG